MAKVTVDDNLCIGCGLCASTCEEVFMIGEDGKSHPKADSCPVGHDLHAIAANCPVAAITVED